MRDCGPRSRSIRIIPRSGCWSSPSTSRPGRLRICSPAPRRASATCSKTASPTSATSSTRSPGSRKAAPYSTRKWSGSFSGPAAAPTPWPRSRHGNEKSSHSSRRVARTPPSRARWSSPLGSWKNTSPASSPSSASSLPITTTAGSSPPSSTSGPDQTCVGGEGGDRLRDPARAEDAEHVGDGKVGAGRQDAGEGAEEPVDLGWLAGDGREQLALGHAGGGEPGQPDGEVVHRPDRRVPPPLVLGERGGKRAGTVQASDDGPGEEFSVAEG